MTTTEAAAAGGDTLPPLLSWRPFAVIPPVAAFVTETPVVVVAVAKRHACNHSKAKQPKHQHIKMNHHKLATHVAQTKTKNMDVSTTVQKKKKRR